MKLNKIIQGDSLEVLKTLPNESVNMIMTSPPYWALRDYGVDGQLGLEKTFEEYITKLCDIFDEVKRVLKKDGTCWVNIGDTYSNQKVGNTETRIHKKAVQNTFKKSKQSVAEKSLVMIPFRFAIEMVNRGWILRNTIIWHKPNCMPQSVKDRFTVDFEYLFFFVKSKRYWFKQQQEKATFPNEGKWTQGSKKDYKDNQDFPARKLHKFVTGDNRNKRSVWRISTKPFADAHFAVYPEALCVTPIKAGCPEDGIVLDPFIGSGTTAKVARKLGRKYVGIDLNPEYIKIAEKRLAQQVLL